MTVDGPGALDILQISPRFTPYVGGTEIHTREVSVELARRGHRVTVLTTDLRGGLPAEEVVDGVRVRRVRAWPRGLDLYLAPGLRRVIDDGPWDVVHVQGYHTAVAPLALAAAQRRGLPTALTFHSGGHGSRLRNLARPAHTRLLGRWLRRCDLLIGVSRFEADLFAERLGLPPDRIRLIPNGVSSTGRPTAVTTDGGDHDGPHLLSIGRLQRYKGHHRVIRALPDLVRSHPGVHLTILGLGPDRGRLERLAGRLGVRDRVAFDHVGADERPRLDAILASASVALFLSEYESHGMAAHEALLAGLPTVVVDDTALAELASTGLARGVPPRATDAEVAAIVRRTLAAEGPARSGGGTGTDGRRAGTDGRRAGLDRLRRSWPDIAGRIEEAYREVTGPTSDGPGRSAAGPGFGREARALDATG